MAATALKTGVRSAVCFFLCLTAFAADAERRVFDNLFVYTGGAKQYPVAFGDKRDKANLVFDGNPHWHSDPAVKALADYFKTSRTHLLSEANKAIYPEGWDAHSIARDPKFVTFSMDSLEGVDLRLQASSPALQAGVPLAAD